MNKKKFNIRVSVGFSTVVQIEASSAYEAEQKVKDMYYEGQIMDGLIENEYYDGLIGVDAESEE